MGEVVNLRLARKRAAREAGDAQADVNRAAFGLPKALRVAAKAEQSRCAARHDGLLLDASKAGPTLQAGLPGKAPDDKTPE